MTKENPLVMVLNRSFDRNDEHAIDMVFARWLAFDIKIVSRRERTEIRFFHSARAKLHLVRELGELFPGEHLTPM